MVSLRLAEAVGSGSLITESHDASFQPLRSDVWLTLQTTYAQLLIRGRDSKGKAPIVGLIGFAGPVETDLARGSSERPVRRLVVDQDTRRNHYSRRSSQV